MTQPIISVRSLNRRVDSSCYICKVTEQMSP